MKSIKSVVLSLALFMLFLLPSIALAEDGIVTDPQDDVYFVDYTDFLSEEVTTDKTDQRPSIDIIKVSYDHQTGSKQVTVTLEVNSRGEIEDGDLSDLDDVGIVLGVKRYEISQSFQGIPQWRGRFEKN